MARMSQKELLDEGIGSMLKKVAQTAGGAVGAVGGALKAASEGGIDATWGGTVKGGVEGAKKGWKGVKKALTSRDDELKEYIADQGYMIKPGTVMRHAKGKKKLRVVDLVDLDYNEKGEEIPGQGYPRPKIFKYEDKRWGEVTRRGSRRLEQRDSKNKPSDKEKADQLDQEEADQLDQEEADTPPETPQPGAPAAAEPQLSQKEVISTSKDVGTAGEFGKTAAQPEAADPGEATKPTRTRDHKKEYARRKELKAQKAAAAQKRSDASKKGHATKKIRKGVNAARSVPKESFSQKNLLSRLHMLRG